MAEYIAPYAPFPINVADALGDVIVFFIPAIAGSRVVLSPRPLVAMGRLHIRS